MTTRAIQLLRELAVTAAGDPALREDDTVNVMLLQVWAQARY
jgi:hypothetical protein